MPSETLREQLERILREHATLPPADGEQRRLKNRLRMRASRVKKHRPPDKDKPC